MKAEFFAFGMCEKWSESKKVEKAKSDPVSLSFNKNLLKHDSKSPTHSAILIFLIPSLA